MASVDSFSNWMDLIQEISKSDGITIGTSDLVKATGVPASQLRYWVEQGYIKPVEVPNERSRKYSYRVVFRVRAIKYFLDNGFTLASAMERVNQFRNLDVQLQNIIADHMEDLKIADNGDIEISLGSINNGSAELRLSIHDGQSKFWTEV
ncbi:transcriptional regulator, MerR family [Pediococcus damnosus]|uniref:Transcriptional regulator, MerR family n=1 Tax=Pediococcus damnosus TaxID=51663 RepID=A0A0R2HMJ1_9LACO|nr:MerR family transcriptional regulator [Pediococcus damnosus]AMV63059.1 transcriptional regulator, MerR family [Pediococcus damnosus]AMV64787.1 transcriptional regulator, MerR family [Pediococcus damnosus]AMV67050.1 transcriptional regulator, MerR family [Pediococcus damnosus]AMV69345.1 transcriptional regulator, MerR family [Pediococcus damnosus]KJU74403.1 hypothetical protein AH70_06950 [Pediococcus damnosus LMG 28219]